VWTALDDTSNWQIFTWRIGDSTAAQLTQDTRDHVNAHISGDRIVWQASTDAGVQYQVFTWRVGDPSPSQITTGAQQHNGPQVSGGRITWGAWDGSHYQVYTAATTHTSATKPSLSPATPKHRKAVRFSAHLSPGAAVVGTRATLNLYHWESKTVRKKVHGKWRKVKVKYWRSRGSLPLAPSAGDPARLSAKTKLKYPGTWRARLTCSGWAGYDPCTSPTKTFSVK
jgi:hypothetical protein